jgi:hypothetical protein
MLSNTSPPEGMPDHGYEMWVTIPENMEVPEPLTKSSFPVAYKPLI